MTDQSQINKIVWAMCNPHVESELGVGPTYQKFITWVTHFLAPAMSMQFVEEEYYEQIWNEMWTNKNNAWQLPRGHSKTELVGIWATLYIAVYQPHNPFYEQYKGKKKKIEEQLLIAGAQPDMNAWSDRIKDFFDKVPELRAYKPEGAKKDTALISWNKMEMQLKNGHKIHLRTIKGKNRGLHVDRIHADDLITESSTLTDKQTIAVWDGAIHGTTTAKEAMIGITGTPLRFTDILFHLKNNPEGYRFHSRPAILNWDKKTVLSPKRRTFEDLMRVKTEIGSIRFSTEYMLNPIDDSISLIKREHINACLDTYFEGMWLKPIFEERGTDQHVRFEKLNYFTFRREDWEAIYVTVDFAFSDKETADWSVLSYYGKKQGKIYKFGFIRSQGLSAMRQFAILRSLKDYFGMTMAGVEENSIHSVIKDIKDFNIPMTLFWLSNKDEAAKLKDTPTFISKRHTVGKLSAILRLGATYENKRIVLPYKTEKDREMIDLQIEESVSWAQEAGKLVEIGRHPDIPITDILVNELQSTATGSIEFATVSAVPYGSAGVEDDETSKRIIVKGKAIVNEGDELQ